MKSVFVVGLGYCARYESYVELDYTTEHKTLHKSMYSSKVVIIFSGTEMNKAGIYVKM